MRSVYLGAPCPWVEGEMRETGRRCQNCQAAAAFRKYCTNCSAKASALYKREERRKAKAVGERYWLDWWIKTYGDSALPKRREYQREYMRKYRQSRRARRAA